LRHQLLHTRHGRLTLIGTLVAVVTGVLVWRAPDLHVVGNAFTQVRWIWVAAAIGLNVASSSMRAIGWHIAVNEALPAPRLRHRYVFSAFAVGMLGNAVLPGRVGDVARTAVLSRRLPQARSTWASIFGSVVAHRLFDVPPTIGLVVYVMVATRIPGWARPGVEIVLAVGGALLVTSFLLVWRHRRHGGRPVEGVGRVRRLLHMAVRGLRILHAPGPALAALSCMLGAWALQLFAVYVTFEAFRIEPSIEAAALVLLVANVVQAFPLWPGSIGLYQAAVGLALVPYAVAYHHGFAYGIGLQAIEVAVGVGLGLVFLAREGVSFAMLKHIPKVSVEDVEDELEAVGTAPAPVQPAPPTRTEAETPDRTVRARITARAR
jgi:uncharacterized membrane protein YbhN (UPF0104 family)